MINGKLNMAEHSRLFTRPAPRKNEHMGEEISTVSHTVSTQEEYRKQHVSRAAASVLRLCPHRLHSSTVGV